jgi:hypothetical protein
MEFRSFGKIARLSRNCIVSEKIDGTNAQIMIEPATSGAGLIQVGEFVLAPGSRSRWLTPEADNFGFAQWVHQNREELVKLGPGRHFGEWWGAGIQRGYGLKERRFSLFNVEKWYDAYQAMLAGHSNNFPRCCHVVPVLYYGTFDTSSIDRILKHLEEEGSKAAPGFMDPEGIVVYHEASRSMFKKTIKNDAVSRKREDVAGTTKH